MPMSTTLRASVPVCIPLAYFWISVFAFCVVVSTPLSRRFLRLPLQLVVIGFIWLSFSTTNLWAEPLDSLWGLLMVVWISHSTSLMWFEQPLSFFDSKDENCRQQTAFCTPQQVSGVAPAKSPRNLATFALVRIGKLVVYGLSTVYLLPRVFPGPFSPMEVSEFDSLHETYLRRLLLQTQHPNPVTLRESLIRSIWAVLWAWGAYALIDAAHDALALLFVVVLRVDAPEAWPPLFGSLADAYSIRRFWGKFWHRGIVLPYLNYGKLFSRRLLGLTPGSTADRVLLFFMVFFLSGVAHALVAWQLGDCCGWVRDIAWFCGNFVAGAVEASVAWQLRSFAARCGYTKQWRKMSESVFAKALGFAWVFAFFFWSVPKWQYPKLYCAMQHEMALLEPDGNLV
ncbi:uncharacterized protein K452DRAFT_307728 [Aplosporella prunicola CBS 121167]|uniref:Wax synthase domain-containing protein n=1 Tax=Aplosporella prunicola CBS 121167 TaxID=1176127 RepID=A0A6A6BF67_9PEZI|nr:uncharacterized protein K452DRAFT_307728 [Aplosporella prunicola CBS 121167]KAF2142812.1 hypothetical protein K452DRAFT_307728 [Aplosporella prunicola CBS 121167]